VAVAEWIPPHSEALDTQPYSLAFVPMRDERQVIVAAMGALGVRLVDVTDPSKPTEIGHYSAYDQGSASAETPFGNASAIATYWYNGRFYSSDFHKVRVFKIDGFERRHVHFFRNRYNPQTQLLNFANR
jgi:hypothetical protein